MLEIHTMGPESALPFIYLDISFRFVCQNLTRALFVIMCLEFYFFYEGRVWSVEELAHVVVVFLVGTWLACRSSKFVLCSMDIT